VHFQQKIDRSYFDPEHQNNLPDQRKLFKDQVRNFPLPLLSTLLFQWVPYEGQRDGALVDERGWLCAFFLAVMPSVGGWLDCHNYRASA
jgi:hypothetical protein